MKVNVEKKPKATIELAITIENSKVKEAYEKALDKAVENTEIEGFRKGKAPRDMVKEKVGERNLYGDVINDLLQIYYPQALKENMIVPIANPKVEIKEFDIDKDLEFTATIATKPEVKVGEYIKPLKESFEARLSEKKKSNESKIKNGEKIDEAHVHVSPNEIIDILTKVSEVEIADILVEEETDRMMSRLLDQAQSIGLSIDQYLKAQNKTADQLKNDYSDIAEKNLKAEFILGKLVLDKNIEVTDKEIEETMAAAGYENVEERMKDNIEKYYIKSILQKNKLISNLIEEIEGENHHEHK
ncbi:hypothetical protein C4561_02355 [candidate division WWE3 bacterium]|jgi:FKBP-type peptidyl-prolyl cis-trans isomerase (trigger factor)|uniref:Trigger factor n=1 Tax=candidate division WWE3 bacterium TaxID=2053526 RepID=A0A3A4ZE33_UNCKA|nr:MAG: hypothetical protein C4561_02355 [candidate division WWE3 bacterium]